MASILDSFAEQARELERYKQKFGPLKAAGGVDSGRVKEMTPNRSYMEISDSDDDEEKGTGTEEDEAEEEEEEDDDDDDDDGDTSDDGSDTEQE